MYGQLAFIDLPDYNDLINFDQRNYTATTVQTTTQDIGQDMFTDLLPWMGVFLLITVVGLILAALAKRIMGAMKRVFGGRKRGRR